MAPKKRQPEPEPEPKPKRTGRSRFKYVGIPEDLYGELKAFAEADERTINSVGKRAIREYLRLHRPGEPIQRTE